jgi:hypothetical protein
MGKAAMVRFLRSWHACLTRRVAALHLVKRKSHSGRCYLDRWLDCGKLCSSIHDYITKGPPTEGRPLGAQELGFLLSSSVNHHVSRADENKSNELLDDTLKAIAVTTRGESEEWCLYNGILQYGSSTPFSRLPNLCTRGVKESPQLFAPEATFRSQLFTVSRSQGFTKKAVVLSARDIS